VEWRKDAACLGHPVENWFPENKEIEEQELAMRICHGCPVKTECLEYSLLHEQDGIWGGVNQTDRRKLRKERGIRIRVPNGEPRANHSNCGTDYGYQLLVRQAKASGEPIKSCDACKKAHSLADKIRREKNPELERTRKRLDARKRVSMRRTFVADKSEWINQNNF
jgi:hypothetical protein